MWRNTLTRRRFLGSTAAASTALLVRPATAQAKYKRCIVTSPEGQKALASYKKGVEAMLALPASHPQNWFHNAFIHLMDCPHGNWWFYSWHRGYLGYFEETIRKLSKDDGFALPYWDWTSLPRIPDSMFDGVLTPTDEAYAPYTKSLDAFTKFFKNDFSTYWNGLNPAQRQQQSLRGYKTFDDLWNDVTGNGTPGNEAFATTRDARYLSRTNPDLDPGTAKDVSPGIVGPGLQVPYFSSASAATSFTSSVSSSHNFDADKTFFSILEGFPHNNVHNCIGGVPAIQPPYGYMTNFLSPVDPIFFLHHANMDRLWDVWTRRQQARHQPILPQGPTLQTYSKEPFLFFVDSKGTYVTNGKAGDYLSTERFGYEYDKAGFGEDLVRPEVVASAAPPAATAEIAGNSASLRPSPGGLRSLLGGAEPRETVAQVTVARPPSGSGVRQFRVFLDASPQASDSGTDSPSYLATIGFFGPQMSGMSMSNEATFAIPLSPAHPALLASMATAAKASNGSSPPSLTLRVVPVGAKTDLAPVLKAVSIETL